VANKLRVVCDVVENEFEQNNKVVINVSDENEGKTLDNMLWSWKQSSFIPHNFTNTLAESNQDPVRIAMDISENISYDTLILVNPAELDVCNNYKRVIDFAEKYNPTKLETDRKRYKLYRDKKFTIETLNPGEFLHK
jgi:DNA polymerase-3 subunit chi